MSKLHRWFFFLTILFLPTQVGRHFWPDWSFVLGRRVDYLSPTIYLTDILIGLMLISWLLNLLATRHSRANGNPSFLKSWIPAFAGMTSVVVINIFFAGNKSVSIYSWLKVLEFAMFGYYIIKTKPDFSRITYFLSLAVLYSSLIAIIQFFLQRSIGGPLWFLGERMFSTQTPGIAQFNWCIFHSCRLILRPYATFPHPNVLGGFLAVTIPLLIFNFQFSTRLPAGQVFNQTKKFSIFKLMTIILGIIALFLTFSRGAWLVGALGIGWMFIPKKLKAVYTLCSAAIFILGIFLIKDFAGTSESVVVREQLNSAAISLSQHSPLFGIGLGNFLVELPKILPARSIYFLQPVHNIYLLLLSEIGIIGFLIFIFLLWYVIRDTKYVISKNQNILLLTYHFSLIIILLLGLVDHYPLTLQQGQLLFTLFLSLSFLKYN